MTKRELIDQILCENHTAEPGFLAQFSDDDLQDYLSHLTSLKEPRLTGDASRFERYFRNGPPAAARLAQWRSTPEPSEGSVGTSDDALDLSAPPAATAEKPAEGKRPVPVRADITLPTEYLDFDSPLPGDADTLNDMQLTPQERMELRAPVADEDEPQPSPAGQDHHEEAGEPAPPPTSSSDLATEEQTWLF